MELSPRAIWLSIAGALLLAVIGGIYFSSDIKKAYLNNYREVGLNYPYEFPGFIKKDSCKNIRIEHLNINNLGDVLCYCMYHKNRGLTIWKIKEFNSIPLSTIKFADSTIELDNHFVFKKIKSVYIRFPCMAMIMEPSLDTALSLSVYVQDGKRDTTVIAPNYIYYYLNFTSMKFYRNNKFNFMIGKYPSAGCDFIICKYKGSFYMLYYYSLNPNPGNPNPVRPGDLLKILDL
jgi:hypothetical protein